MKNRADRGVCVERLVMPSAVFIYMKGAVGKDDKYKCLGTDATPNDEKKLKDDGWELIASVNAAVIIERLLNLSDEGRMHMLYDITLRRYYERQIDDSKALD